MGAARGDLYTTRIWEWICSWDNVRVLQCKSWICFLQNSMFFYRIPLKKKSICRPPDLQIHLHRAIVRPRGVQIQSTLGAVLARLWGVLRDQGASRALLRPVAKRPPPPALPAQALVTSAAAVLRLLPQTGAAAWIAFALGCGCARTRTWGRMGGAASGLSGHANPKGHVCPIAACGVRQMLDGRLVLCVLFVFAAQVQIQFQNHGRKQK